MVNYYEISHTLQEKSASEQKIIDNTFEVLLLQAALFQQQNRTSEVLYTLRRALAIAEQHHIQNSFPLCDSLSARELEVLACLCNGLTNQEIAQKLVVTVGTVKRHTNNIYNKLGVKTRTQAVIQAQIQGLYPSGESRSYK